MINDRRNKNAHKFFAAPIQCRDYLGKLALNRGSFSCGPLTNHTNSIALADHLHESNIHKHMPLESRQFWAKNVCVLKVVCAAPFMFCTKSISKSKFKNKHKVHYWVHNFSPQMNCNKSEHAPICMPQTATGISEKHRFQRMKQQHTD